MPVFGYEDIQLVPDKCIISSRSEAGMQVTLDDYILKLPVTPANTQTIIDENIVEGLTKNGYFYIMHRFDEEAHRPFAKRVRGQGLVASISVGAKGYEYDFVISLKDDVPEFITIDITHGHSNSMTNIIQHIRKELPKTLIIAGNVGTSEAAYELEDAGADATKVGISPGKVCIIKVKTGFGTSGWQLAVLRRCAKATRKPIIANSGVHTHSDIARSIRFGVTMIVIGSLFAGRLESSGKLVEINGERYKKYYGSASEYQKGEHKNVEGKKILLPVKGHLKDTLVEMQGGLQSVISYAGGRDSHNLARIDYVIIKNSIWDGDST